MHLNKLIGLVIVMVCFSQVRLCHAKTDLEHLDEIQAQHDVDKAIGKGLQYLVSQQDKVEGKFHNGMPNTYTALACMALMAAGQIPGQSKYGDHLQRGIMYLVRKSKENKGYFGKEGKARMYGHGICALALCEAYGMMRSAEDNAKVKEAIERALNVILNSQAHKHPDKGGWRYEPRVADSDLSVTVWQILALRSAKNCQLAVPDKTIKEAIEYVQRSFNKQQKGYAYQPNNGNASPAMRSAGVVALLALGAKGKEHKKQIEESSKFLKDHKTDNASYFWYTSYYLATAANMLGEEMRDTLLPRLEKSLMKLQKDNGEFPQHSNGHDGGVYSTAFGIICLCVHYQYLPIYQE